MLEKRIAVSDPERSLILGHSFPLVVSARSGCFSRCDEVVAGRQTEETRSGVLVPFLVNDQGGHDQLDLLVGHVAYVPEEVGQLSPVVTEVMPNSSIDGLPEFGVSRLLAFPPASGNMLVAHSRIWNQIGQRWPNMSVLLSGVFLPFFASRLTVVALAAWLVRRDRGEAFGCPPACPNLDQSPSARQVGWFFWSHISPKYGGHIGPNAAQLRSASPTQTAEPAAQPSTGACSLRTRRRPAPSLC